MFVAASAGCAASDGFATLIAWRVVQGFAGGVLIPIVFSAVFLLFPQRGQTLATTIAGVLAVLAPTVGPLAGGWITSTWSWHWLFLVNIAPGILAALAGWLLLPRDEARLGEVRTLDVVSVVLLAVGLASLEIGLKEAPQARLALGHVLGLLARRGDLRMAVRRANAGAARRPSSISQRSPTAISRSAAR